MLPQSEVLFGALGVSMPFNPDSEDGEVSVQRVSVK